MKLIELTWQHRNDFDGILECEHCGECQTMRYGYQDDNFHRNVIPKFTCLSCKKNRAGEIVDENTNGGVKVKKTQVVVDRLESK
jgi:hypothetical protein